MKILVSAVLGVLAACAAYAGDRGDAKPYNVSNGRATQTTQSAQPKIFVVGNAPGGGAAANTGAPEAPAGIAAGGGGRAIAGGGGGGRSARGVRKNGHKSFWGGKVRGADGGGSTEEVPPNYTKPGALIRTTGQAPKYEAAEVAKTHTADAGEIVLSKHKMVDIGKAPTVQVGPKDTLPPPNPVEGKSYGTAAAANGPTGGTGGSGANSGGGQIGGHDNNGSGNNDRQIPGDTTDPQGGDKAKEAAFYDAY